MQHNTQRQAMRAACLATTLLAASPALAFDLPMIFDDRTAWLDATGPANTEDFEGPNALGALASPSIFDSGLGVAVTGQAMNNSAVEAGDPGGYGLGNTTLGGSQYLRLGSGALTGDYNIQFLLPQPSIAFGFDIFDRTPGFAAGEHEGTVFQFFNDGEEVSGLILLNPAGTVQSPEFFGFLADSFTFNEVRITIWEVASPDGGPPFLDVTGIDEVSWVVPSTGSGAPLALACGLTARRRRSCQSAHQHAHPQA